MPERYRNLLTFNNILYLERTFYNYKIITTQDYVLKARQKLVREGKLSSITYKKFEKDYLETKYGMKNLVSFGKWFRNTKRDKF